MPDLSCSPDDYEDHEAYALAMAALACNETVIPHWALRGIEDEHVEREYAIEATRGANSRSHTDELAAAIDELVDYRDGARLITREIIYGPWRYVIPEEIES